MGLGRPKVGLDANTVFKKGMELHGSVLMILGQFCIDTSFDKYRSSTFMPLKFRLAIREGACRRAQAIQTWEGLVLLLMDS